MSALSAVDIRRIAVAVVDELERRRTSVPTVSGSAPADGVLSAEEMGSIRAMVHARGDEAYEFALATHRARFDASWQRRAREALGRADDAAVTPTEMLKLTRELNAKRAEAAARRKGERSKGE